MSRSPYLPPIQLASREQMRLAKKLGERRVGTDGDTEIVGYVYAGNFYVTEENHHKFRAAKRSKAAHKAGHKGSI